MKLRRSNAGPQAYLKWENEGNGVPQARQSAVNGKKNEEKCTWRAEGAPEREKMRKSHVVGVPEA